MSPLLFILMLEGLILALLNEAREGSISGVKVDHITRLLIILFVDDVLILNISSYMEWENIQGILSSFYRVVGLCINVNKS